MKGILRIGIILLFSTQIILCQEQETLLKEIDERVMKIDRKVFVPDTALGDFALNAKTGLFKDPDHFLDSLNGEGPGWYYLVLDQSRDQVLRMWFYPGADYDRFSYFEVFPAKKIELDNMKYAVSDGKSFQTESGVHLGLSRQELIDMKGSSYIESRSNTSLLVYQFGPHSELSEFLKQNNEAGYIAKYYFREDVLIKFEFGFVLP